MKRTERFCDFMEPLTEKTSYGGTIPRKPLTKTNKDGACIEPAVGRCIRCKRDFCERHAAYNMGLELRLGNYIHHWKIDLCHDCGNLESSARFKLSRQEEKIVKQLLNSISASFALLGRTKAKPKVKEETKSKSYFTSKSYLALPPEEKLLRAIFGEPLGPVGPMHQAIDGTTLRDKILSLLSDPHFPEREAKVIRLRFGFNNTEGVGLSLAEVGKVFDVTRERIRQIEGKALRKLRYPSRSKQLKPYLPDEQHSNQNGEGE